MGFMALFKKKEPKDLVREWQTKIRTEMRGVDRQIRDITREEKGVQKSIKDCAKREDLRSMRVLAKEIVSSRKTVARLHENKAQMNSVSMMLTEQLATVRSVGHLEKSTEVLSAMNLLTRNAAVRDSMREMSKEMAKSGLIEEIVNDALEDIHGVDDLEGETEAEVNKILAELAGEVTVSLPASEKTKVSPVAAPKETEPQGETQGVPINDLQARLDAIRAVEEAS